MDLFNIPRSAMGNVFAQNGIQKFARGGIVDKPTMFPFAKGIGLMGEAGPEAIMPLRRGRDGRLGVQATNGGGAVSVTVNVDAAGSNVQGDGNQANQLGKAIGIAVQQELIKQKRPGGLLN
jgi:lambda family phage tail tape measure protein